MSVKHVGGLDEYDGGASNYDSDNGDDDLRVDPVSGVGVTEDEERHKDKAEDGEEEGCHSTRSEKNKREFKPGLTVTIVFF